MRTYSIAKAVNLCIALMNHNVEKAVKGYVAPVRLPPCIPAVDRTARLGEQTHEGVLSRALWQELIVYLKNTDEYKELKNLHRMCKQGTRDAGCVHCRLHLDYVHRVHCVHPGHTLFTPPNTLHTPSIGCDLFRVCSVRAELGSEVTILNARHLRRALTNVEAAILR
eukprot:8644706-Pyramimonas_sp.AAC.1